MKLTPHGPAHAVLVAAAETVHGPLGFGGERVASVRRTASGNGHTRRGREHDVGAVVVAHVPGERHNPSASRST